MHKQLRVRPLLVVFAFGYLGGMAHGENVITTLSTSISPAEFSVIPSEYGRVVLNPKLQAGTQRERRYDRELPASTMLLRPASRRPFADDAARRDRLTPSTFERQLTADAWNVPVSSARPPYDFKLPAPGTSLNPGYASVNVRPKWLDDLAASNAHVESALRAAWMHELLELRKRYPYVSVASRLPAEQKKQRIERPILTEDAVHALGEMEASRIYRQGADAEAEFHRVYTLQALHSGNVGRFRSAEGFGFSRMIGPQPKFSPEYVEYAAAPPVDVEPAATLSGEFGTSRPLALPSTVAASRTDRYRLPSTDVLGAFHRESQFAFVPGGSLGDVQSAESVAGFTPHGFRQMPAWPDESAVHHAAAYKGAKRPTERTFLPPPVPAGRWKVTRLELLGVILHKEPRVYEADQLPRMEDLEKYSTRPLNAFEAASLKRLQLGEQVESQAELNEIQMLGALRAAKQCMKCHNVPHGTLLGAFSYTLQRDPLLTAKEINGDELIQ